MSQVLTPDEIAPLNRNQRWNSYLVIAAAAAMLFLGLTLRNNALNATQTFEDLEAGIRAQLPANWLIDTQTDEYVVRAQDPYALPFKTTLQIAVMPVGPDATPNLVLDVLNLDRAPRFSTYREISRADTTLRDNLAKRMTYTYVQYERNPFQASLPIVVQGIDVVVLRRGQAVILTYREESSAFDANLPRFERLLDTVEIF